MPYVKNYIIYFFLTQKLVSFLTELQQIYELQLPCIKLCLLFQNSSTLIRR